MASDGLVGNPQHRAMRAAYVPKPCVICSEPLTWQQAKRKGECCSRRCSNKRGYHAKSGVTCFKTCECCGRTYRSKPAERYCGDTCRVFAAKSAGQMPRRYIVRLLLIKQRKRTLNIDDMMDMLERQSGLCAVTGRVLTFTSGEGHIPSNCSIDRKDAKRGYTLDNVQLTCTMVNRMKFDVPQSEFVQWCRDVVAWSERA